MEKKKIQTYEVVINDDEIDTILSCLLYCKHRYEKHPESGVRKSINIDKLTKLVNELKAK